MIGFGFKKKVNLDDYICIINDRGEEEEVLVTAVARNTLTILHYGTCHSQDITWDRVKWVQKDPELLPFLNRHGEERIMA